MPKRPLPPESPPAPGTRPRPPRRARAIKKKKGFAPSARVKKRVMRRMAAKK